jgi:signal transduction histidine kinase
MSTTAVRLTPEVGRSWVASGRIRWIVLGAGVVVGSLAAVAPYVSLREVPISDYAPESPETVAAHVAIGMSFILVGLLAWSRRPANRVGVLMTAVGLAFFVTDLGWIDTPATFIFADEWRGIAYALLFHLLLAFPSGCLESKLDRIYVGAFYAYVLVLRPFPSTAFYDPHLEGPSDAPANPLLVRGDPDLNMLVDRWLGFIDLAFVVVLLVLVVRHWHRAGRHARRALSPVFPVVTVVLLPLLVGVIIGLKSQQSLLFWGVQLTLALLPLGFLVGLLWSRLARAAVADLVIDLQQAHDPAHVRAALARALDDATLQVGYRLATAGTYVDAAGEAVEVPPSEAGRAVTLVGSDGEPVAALVHESALTDEPRLVDAVAAAARLALENQRLQAELRAQLAEVRASRARIVAAGDSERRRLERDLHDGAQQRLLSLGLALQLARAELGERASSANELLEDAERELQEALHELRELARGIHPAILTDGGLVAALRTCAQRVPVPISTAVDDRRLSPAVETAAYFIVSEALANVAKHARASRASVVVRSDARRTVVIVEDDGIGGAYLDRGSGLRGLKDRAEALGGCLAVDSEAGKGTRVRAELPCE